MAAETRSGSMKWYLLGFVLILAAVGAAVTFMMPRNASGLVEDPSIPIGGEFVMTSHTGERMTHENFLGSPTIFYFGFTFCPDICPTQLVEISDALDQAGVTKDDIDFVFVTIDPERDTPQAMSDYVSAFHPDLVGLTGTEQQVADMAKAYRIFYSRIDRPDLPEAYTMDHSTFTYVMGPNGHYMTHFNHGVTRDEIASVIQSVL